MEDTTHQCIEQIRDFADKLEAEGSETLHIAVALYKVFNEKLEKGEVLNEIRAKDFLDGWETISDTEN